MKKTGRFKKSITMMAMALMLSVTAVAGFGISAKAAETKDKWYFYNNGNVSGNSEWRNKTNTTKVYVHPKSGPKISYTVQGRTSTDSTEWFDASGTYDIPNGVKASITNHVREWYGVQARLYFERIQNINLDTSGVWSPDSLGIYTIYG